MVIKSVWNNNPSGFTVAHNNVWRLVINVPLVLLLYFVNIDMMGGPIIVSLITWLRMKMKYYVLGLYLTRSEVDHNFHTLRWNQSLD